MGHLEINDEYQLLTNGFVIYCENYNKWTLTKISTKNNPDIVEKTTFESYNNAKEFALKFLNSNNKWIAIVRYDRGLGIEYKTIENIRAFNIEQAREIAFSEMLKTLNDKNMIKEIKVKNKI